MRKWLGLCLVIVMTTMLFAGGGAAAEGDKKTILYYCPNIGDYSDMDMGDRVTDAVAAKYGLEKTLVEYGQDRSLAVPSLLDALESKHYDYCVSTSWNLTDAILANADKFSDTTFIIFDTSPAAVFDKENVYGIYFGQNEGGFLVSVYSALMSKTGVIGLALINDTPILNDFATGWLAGYQYAADALGKNGVDMKMAYMGESQMSQTYETAKVMFDQDKIDYLWCVASNLIQGACQAAEDNGGLKAGYAVIGVDLDQWSYFHQVNPTLVGIDNIVTSMEKRVEVCVARVFDSIFGDGSIQPGNTFYGIKEDGTGLSYNENFLNNTPQEIQDIVYDVEAKIRNGEIEVPSYFGFATHDDFLAFRNEREALVE